MEITRLLRAWSDGDQGAFERLAIAVYAELRRIAHGYMRHERPDQTLQATALVHEAYLRLVGNEEKKWAGRAHFFGAAAEAMRRILIDNARRKRAQRHGGGQQRVDVQNVEIAAVADDEQLLAIHEALDKLAVKDKTKAELVKLRYFMGMTIEETAQLLGISEPTAKRHWTYARAWLYNEVQRGGR